MPTPEVLDKLWVFVGQPAALLAALYVYERVKDKKRNGMPSKEITAAIAAGFKEISAIVDAMMERHIQHADIDRTKHFDQLRRDLSTTIEKGMENSIMKYFWELEQRGERRSRPR